MVAIISWFFKGRVSDTKRILVLRTAGAIIGLTALSIALVGFVRQFSSFDATVSSTLVQYLTYCASVKVRPYHHQSYIFT